MEKNKVKVPELPKCDLCEDKAKYDARIPCCGSWAYLCELHFKQLGCHLGLGKGQLLQEDKK